MLFASIFLAYWVLGGSLATLGGLMATQALMLLTNLALVVRLAEILLSAPFSSSEEQTNLVG